MGVKLVRTNRNPNRKPLKNLMLGDSQALNVRPTADLMLNAQMANACATMVIKWLNSAVSQSIHVYRSPVVQLSAVLRVNAFVVMDLWKRIMGNVRRHP